MKSYIDIFNLEGKVAVITGGATGLGFSMAQCLAGANATVVLVGRREEELQHACREIGERAHYIRCDITDFEGIPVLVFHCTQVWRDGCPYQQCRHTDKKACAFL